MFQLSVERVADVAVVLCQGRMVRSDAVFQLRDAVTQQREVRAILLDLSELESIGGGGVGMLTFLREWARYRGIQLWLFDPVPEVRKSLLQVRSTAGLKLASMDEVMELLDWEWRKNDTAARGGMEASAA